MSTVTLDYLIPDLRMKIGDTTSASYRYLDEWLKASLVYAAKYLSRYWRDKYLIDENGVISRNTLVNEFWFDESYGVIEKRDEPIIVLVAAITTLEGSLENNAWNAVSWKDAEISFSNLESFRQKDSNLRRFIDELNSLMLPPTKRLTYSKKNSLPGYLNNPYEKKTDY